MMSKVFNTAKLLICKPAPWVTRSPNCTRRGVHCGTPFLHSESSKHLGKWAKLNRFLPRWVATSFYPCLHLAKLNARQGSTYLLANRKNKLMCMGQIDSIGIAEIPCTRPRLLNSGEHGWPGEVRALEQR